MAQLIATPSMVEVPGTPVTVLAEFVGRLASGEQRVSIAILEFPPGWSEPGQTPEFDEFTVVLEGQLLVETRDGDLVVSSGQAVHTTAGQWVRYSTPHEGARYVSVCLPAYAPELAHPDPGSSPPAE
jgi:ethanolamine utilization protein EutQ (cupin superfamily)